LSPRRRGPDLTSPWTCFGPKTLCLVLSIFAHTLVSSVRSWPFFFQRHLAIPLYWTLDVTRDAGKPSPFFVPLSHVSRIWSMVFFWYTPFYVLLIPRGFLYKRLTSSGYFSFSQRFPAPRSSCHPLVPHTIDSSPIQSHFVSLPQEVSTPSPFGEILPTKESLRDEQGLSCHLQIV